MATNGAEIRSMLPNTISALIEGLHASKMAGYGAKPIPCATDNEVVKLVHYFVKANDADKHSILMTITEDQSFTLLAFAERMASLGVRKKSEQPIFDGLIALVLEDGRFDPRENLTILSLFNDACRRIGLDPVSMFSKAASNATSTTASLFHGFVERPPELKSITTMGYAEELSPEGFVYKRSL